jgi:esterase/lipase superfamily enzyme
MRAALPVLIAGLLALAAPGGAARAQDQPNLAELNLKIEALRAGGNDAEALPLAKQYAALVRQRHGENNPEFATAITWLASLYESEGNAAEAERLFRKALQIRARIFGPDHAQVATSLSNLAALYQSQGRDADAEQARQRAASIRTKGEGSDELDALKRQVQELQWSGRGAEALPLAENYVAAVRARYGEEHRDYATAIGMLGSLYSAQGRAEEAESLLKQALALEERLFGANSKEVAGTLFTLAALYTSQGREEEAAALSARAREIQGGRMPAAFRVARQLSYAVVKVYYATDRLRTSASEPARIYGGDRGELALGFCTVSIPRDHRMGEVEAPSIWRLEWSEDPDQHVVLLSVTEQDKQSFYDDVARRVGSSAGKSAFVFVHGYNVTFADAARRTAQMAYDLGFDGAPVFYSWPSQASYAAYHVDETNAEWSQIDFKNFLKDFAQQSGAENIFLIAHSMGSRVLTNGLKELLQENPIIRAQLKEIILAAPDIDADTFKRDLAPRILPPVRSTTLYASSKDYALTASKHFAGYRRAGDTAGGVTVVEGLDTIDASNIRTDFVGHSYYGDSESVLGDLRTLILNRKRAEERSGLTPVESSAGRYWAFSP